MSETIYYPTATTLVNSNTTITVNATIGVDRTSTGAYLVPSTSNAATITQWIQRTVNNNASPYWANVYTFGLITATIASNAYYSCVNVPDGRVIFVPFAATNVGTFNPKINSFTTVAFTGTAGVTIPGGASAYQTGVLLPNGNVCFAPCNATNVGLFNPYTNSFSTAAFTGTAGVTIPAGSSAYYGSVLLPSGSVVFVPNNATNVGLFNPITNTFSTVAFSGTTGVTIPGGNGAYVGGVLLPNGTVVFTPSNQLVNANIGLFNPATNSFSTVTGPNSTWPYAGSVLLPNGNVLFVPFRATNVGIFNPTTNIFTSQTPTGATLPGSDSYIGGVLLPNGNVVFISGNAQRVAIYNPNTNVLSTYTGPSAAAGYLGGVLIPDGRVIYSPNAAGGVGILMGYNRPVAPEFCLHPFFNKF